MQIPKPLILFIDAYDSFSNNIISLLETTLNASVRTIKIDNPVFATDEDLLKELNHYAAVVCGPGPGHPAKEKDVGVIRRIWRLNEAGTIPVLGICLGFQSLCLEFGGDIKRLKGPQHGMIRRVSHVGDCGAKDKDSIFAGVGTIQATLYQSLCADIGQASIANGNWDTQKWIPLEKCPELVPLAWVESDLSERSNSGVEDDRVLVAVRHCTKPFWGLQYHPESICTNQQSIRVIGNWFKQVNLWNKKHRWNRNAVESPIQGDSATLESLLSRTEHLRPMLNGSASFPSAEHPSMQHRSNALGQSRDNLIYYSRTVDKVGHISVADVVEAVQNMRQDQIILESSNTYETSVGSADVRGRYSIIALDVDDSLRFEYSINSNKLSAIYPSGSSSGQAVELDTNLPQFGGIWPFLAQYLEKRQVSDGNKESPFWGGFMGYTTYELGLEGIAVTPKGHGRQHARPDLSLAWVSRSLVVDHVKGSIYIQELATKAAEPHVTERMDQVASKLENLVAGSFQNGASSTPSLVHGVLKDIPPSISLPNNEEYESKVRRCQEYIRSGDSYELCLTDQTTVTRQRQVQSPISSDKHSPTTSEPSWNLYKTLRNRQPAPFASFIRLGSATLVSSSPERFLKWDAQGKCELRPMKGTVRKSPTVNTLALATELLDVPKEKAENLMIVDLVRHDLHGVCGSGNVAVPRLMVVEEYKSVFQMISVVEGQIPPPLGAEIKNHMSDEQIETARKTRYTGMDVLAASLPPGSMTGAPKKRSCQILQELEDGRERSLYSGVVGYMDVGGRGDWSVTIRSMFRWDDEDTTSSTDEKTMETWHIGAGGAVTALSTPENERDEMQTKLNGTLGIFR
ncbi:ADC synthase [Venustampulla echinocandica]|uniref:aminodeoxychorismate synthase n=1 Tax=Venustampulla echinocandica TaxID=2656787 RepID=A0A370TIS0_9HELO|nr:ADC synthase [Venustampulla echinocandica]RDL35248.1 ADC synthase [Venustampulla echinocandica]